MQTANLDGETNLKIRKALERTWDYLTPEKASELEKLFTLQLEDNTDKIETAKTIFNESGSSKATQEAIEMYTFKAFETLEKMDIALSKKEILRAFGENLMGRKV